MERVLRPGMRVVLGGTLALVLLVSLTLLIFSLIYSPEYVFRVLRFGRATVYDYQKFPARALENGPTPFHFSTRLDEARVRALFQPIFQTDDLDAFLAQQHTQAFIVIHDDTILYEHYFNGTQRDSIVTSFSMAKSFTSALVGHAIADGAIQSVNDPITKYVPELADRDPRFSNITIRHLLMMSSGMRYVEFPLFWGDDTKTYYYPDLRQLTLRDTQIIDPPGRSFLYNNYHPMLLGMILERATGTTVAQYLQAKVWKPIGMEFGGSWSIDSETSGFEKMESGINARAIDFARFGRLYLKQGNWDGTQVIPAAWVAESTQADTSVDPTYYAKAEFGPLPGKGYYKYMWWGMRRDNGAYDFYARGNYGQFIYVSPQKNLIIVRNGADFGILGDSWVEGFYKFASAIEPHP